MKLWILSQWILGHAGCNSSSILYFHKINAFALATWKTEFWSKYAKILIFFWKEVTLALPSSIILTLTSLILEFLELNSPLSIPISLCLLNSHYSLSWSPFYCLCCSICRTHSFTRYSMNNMMCCMHNAFCIKGLCKHELIKLYNAGVSRSIIIQFFWLYNLTSKCAVGFLWACLSTDVFGVVV